MTFCVLIRLSERTTTHLITKWPPCTRCNV